MMSRRPGIFGRSTPFRRRVAAAVATVPAAPSAFARSGALMNYLGQGSVVVSWTAPANGGAAITSYSVTYKWFGDSDGDLATPVTLYTTTQDGTSLTIQESLQNGLYYPGAPQNGSQPRWFYGGNVFQILVAATNSVGTGTAGQYLISTGGGG